MCEIYLGELEREKKAHYPNSRNWKELSLRFLLGIKRAFEDDLEKKRAFSSVLELLALVVLSLGGGGGFVRRLALCSRKRTFQVAGEWSESEIIIRV